MSDSFEIRHKYQAQMKSKLESLGLPFKEIHVCGNVVGVKCISRDTAEKWHSVLNRFVRSSISETMFINKENEGTFLLPTKHYGYSVGGLLRS